MENVRLGRFKGTPWGLGGQNCIPPSPHKSDCNQGIGGIFALRARCALLLDYVPPEEPPSTPLGIR